jgi:hypothetical protein
MPLDAMVWDMHEGVSTGGLRNEGRPSNVVLQLSRK